MFSRIFFNQQLRFSPITPKSNEWVPGRHSSNVQFRLQSCRPEAKPVLYEIFCAKLAELFRDFSIVLSKDEWEIANNHLAKPLKELRCDFLIVFSKDEREVANNQLVQHRTQIFPGAAPVKPQIGRMPTHIKKKFLKKWSKSFSMN